MAGACAARFGAVHNRAFPRYVVVDERESSHEEAAGIARRSAADPGAAGAADRRRGGLGGHPLRRDGHRVTDLDDPSVSYPVITGDYTVGVRWEPRDVTVGAPVAKPTPIFRKLDDEAVARERELTTASGE